MTRLGHPRPKSRSQYSGVVPGAAIRTGGARFHRIAPIDRVAMRAERFAGGCGFHDEGEQPRPAGRAGAMTQKALR